MQVGQSTVLTEWSRLTSSEIPALNKDLPIIIPIGLIEAHGPHLSLSVDVDTAEHFGRAIAEKTGAILAPTLPYGFADEMREYPGTIGLRPQTLMAVIADVVEMFCFHGFTKLIFLSGHGANKMPCEMAFWKAWESYPDAKLAYWNWWTEAGVAGIHHADKGETEVAAVTGADYYPDRARDFQINKPWYKIRSRYVIHPESGGINGEPTSADLAQGKLVRDKVIEVLSAKVAKIITKPAA